MQTSSSPTPLATAYGHNGNIALSSNGLAHSVDRDLVGGLLGADRFAIGFDVSADTAGESGEIFRFGSNLIVSVNGGGELTIRASTEAGMKRLTTADAGLSGKGPHAIEIGYEDGALAVSVGGKDVGRMDMPPLAPRGWDGADLYIGNPWNGDNYEATLSGLKIETPTQASSQGSQAAPPPAAAAVAQNGVIAVSSRKELYDALRDAGGGEIILLEGGNYGKFRLDPQSGFDFDFPSDVTIASADPDDPAIFTGLNVRKASHLVFEGITFDYSFAPGDKTFTRDFRISGSDHITIRDSLFDGDVARDVSPVVDGHGWGTGLFVRKSSNVTIEGTEFRDFWKGAVLLNLDDLTLRDNDMHSMRMDGLNLAAIKGALIENNRIHDFDTATGSNDHADMIQFWTNGTDRPSTDIVIRGNTLDIGEGGSTQSIFMRNDMVDRGFAGYDMYYRDITIEDNVIVNGHRHGITLGESDGVWIRNNSVLHADGDRPDGADTPIEIPRINVSSRARNVTISNNATSEIAGHKSQSDWTVSRNAFVQDQDPDDPGHYSEVFLTSSLQPVAGEHAFIARSGGLLDSMNAGAPATLAPDDGLIPAFHIVAPDADASVRIFDASHSTLDGAALPSGARFKWTFSDGSVVTDESFAAVFDGGRDETVELSVTVPGGTTRAVSHAFEVLSADLVDYTAGGPLRADGNVDLGSDPALTRNGLEIDQKGVALEIDRKHVVDMIGADEFSVSMQIEGARGDTGDVFRLGSAFIATVNGKGELSIRATTEDGSIRLKTSGAALNDGRLHDVNIALDAGDLTITVDGETVGETAMAPLKDRSDHGLYFGNPWGKNNFDSILPAFEITANASDFDDTRTDHLPMLAGYDTIVIA